jgi:PAS domain S-box-containing protein
VCHFEWGNGRVPEFPEMRARSRAALNQGVPGYEQVFHYQHPVTGDIWLHEKVTIKPVAPDEWDLVGIITDITVQRRSEEAQRASEQRLGELLARADCLLWESTVVLNPAGWQWHHNLRPSLLYQRLTGSPLPKSPGIMWPDSIPERPEMDRRCREALLAGRPGYEQNFRFVKEDGEVVWISENVTIHPLGDNRYWLVGVAVDITARKEAESARQASEQRLQELLARADCLLWEATADLAGSEWSWHFNIQPSLLCMKLYGVPKPPPEEGLWRKFDIPERPVMNERCLAAMREGRSGYEQVFHIVRPDGSEVWISENVTVRQLASNRYSLVGVAVDITAQHGAEEALAAEKERLAVTLRAMHESVITTDTSGRIQFMNPAASMLTGLAIEDCAGRPVSEVLRLESVRSGQVVPVPYAKVAQGGVVADLPAQTRLVAGDGRRRQIEGCCAPIHATDSRVTGMVLVMRDVTEQERLEQELVRATRLESVGVLAGGIAHDFNNILTAVMGNLALAQLDITPESPAGGSLRSAEKAALRARDLTQQLLTFAKGGEPVRAAIQLEAVVREMAAFALHGSQVKAHYDMAPDLWPADADKGQIGRVVQNLVINAVQAMPRGGSLRIVARNDTLDGLSQPGLAPGSYIQIAISDTGEGIKPENLGRIFDPYFTTKQTGTGLGLAAVYSIIKKHHGHIEAESQVGQGTTFRFWLPASREQVAASETRTPWNDNRAMKGRVLFMDDEQIIRDMAAALLQRFGLSVDCAVDGAEAIEKYQAARAEGRPYDLVIMDLTVPGGMGGLAALGHLKKIDPSVKAVVSSGYSSDPVLANHRDHGFAAVMAKPYEVGDVGRVLRELLPGL